MNVFVDYLGHSDLHYSMHTLFEKHLQANLYRPIGGEWLQKGFHVATEDPREVAGIPELIDNVYHIPMKMEADSGCYTQKAITFDKFLQMDFDVVVTTYHAHEELFYKLLTSYKPKTVLIRQIGNIHEKPLGFCKNILLGQLTPMPAGINYIIYHPEHYEGYSYIQPWNHTVVQNFADYFPSAPHWDLAAWHKFESSLPNFTFRMHGGNGRDHPIPHYLMPQAIKESGFIWHVKAQGGGGFIARQALACGRPCIIRSRYAITHNELAKNLFFDSINCVDLDLGVERAINLIRMWSQPESHIEVCKATAEKFKKDVNFDAEAETIKNWINNLLRR